MASGAVHLTIADAMEWRADHLRLLQEKLNTYLAFVESGELLSAYPAAADRPVIFDLLLRHRPDAEAALFLERARARIAQTGFTLRHGPLPEDEVWRARACPARGALRGAVTPAKARAQRVMDLPWNHGGPASVYALVSMAPARS